MPAQEISELRHNKGRSLRNRDNAQLSRRSFSSSHIRHQVLQVEVTTQIVEIVAGELTPTLLPL